MTHNGFARIRQALFNELVAKRQAHVTAGLKLDELLDRCPCNRGCSCALAGEIARAKVSLGSAAADRQECEIAYAEFCKD